MQSAQCAIKQCQDLYLASFTRTRSLRALVRIGVSPYGHIVNWSNPCMGPMKLRWGSADGMAIRGRGVELHITQCSGGSWGLPTSTS